MGLFLPIMVLFEKVIAFLKQVIVAGFFGTNELTDAYQVAENIVSILRGAFANSIPVVFLAMLAQKKTKKDEWDRFSAESVGTGMAIVFSVTCICIVTILFIQAQAETMADEYTASLYRFILVLLPTVFLGFLSSMMSAQLEAEKVYWPAKIVSLLTSVCVIATVVLFFAKVGLVSIFIGEIVALVMHIALLLVLMRHQKVLVQPRIRFKDNDVLLVWKNAVPLIISSSVYSVNSLIDKAIAMEITAGSATVLQYARVLTLDLFPAIIVTAFSGVLVRDFSEMVASKKDDELSSFFELFLLTLTGFLGVVALVSAFNSENLISMAFQRGAFDENSVQLTNSAFLGYSLGVFLLPVREVSARVHYAFNDTKVPFASSMIGIGINIVLSVLLSRVFGLSGIAIATSVSILTSGIINIAVLRKKRHISIVNLGSETIKGIAGFGGVLLVNCIFKKYCCLNNRLIYLLLVSVLSLIIYYLITGLLKSKSTEFAYIQIWRRSNTR